MKKKKKKERKIRKTKTCPKREKKMG